MANTSLVQLKDLRNELDEVSGSSWSDVEVWAARAAPFIKANFPQFFEQFEKMTCEPLRPAPRSSVAKAYRTSSDPTGVRDEHRKNCEDAKRKIIAFLNGIEAASATQSPVDIPNSLDVVTTLCRRFSLIARELRHRRDNRVPLPLTDEYDVQYLLHALLKIHFDDVRSEEWTPSYAGASARMDFLLRSEKIVIEAKMTRLGLKDREVGEELLIDIESMSITLIAKL